MIDFIRVPVKNEALFVRNSLVESIYSEENGIKVVTGRTRSNESREVIQAYLFDSDRWSGDAAREWVNDNYREDKTTVERRYVSSEMRLDYDKKAPRIRGYAAKFNAETVLWPGFREKVAPGAFTDTIKNDDVRALINHDPNKILGRHNENTETLRLWEDDVGLGYEILPPDTSAARDLMVSIKRGDVSQSSFGFEITKRSIELLDEETGEMLRTIEKVRLYDVSPVTYPAYPQTEVAVRMNRFENECICFLGNEVIRVPSEKRRAEESHADVFSKIDETLKKFRS